MFNIGTLGLLVPKKRFNHFCSTLLTLRIPDGSYSIKASRIRFLCFCILVLGRHLNTDILLMQLSKHYNILHNDLINQDIVRGGGHG